MNHPEHRGIASTSAKYRKLSPYYSEFAAFYDRLGWNRFAIECAHRLLDIIRFKSPKAKSVLDFACGTGELEFRLRKTSLSITGVDISPAMLEVARKKNRGSKFLLGDMTKIKLGRRFDVACCFFDSMNHLRSYAELRRFIRNAAYHLEPEGLFVFDILSPSGLAKWELFDLKRSADYTVMTRGEVNNRQLKAEIIIEGFVKQRSGLYRGFRQVIYERAFAFESLIAYLNNSGFHRIAVSSFDPDESIEQSSRWFVVARKL